MFEQPDFGPSLDPLEKSYGHFDYEDVLLHQYDRVTRLILEGTIVTLHRKGLVYSEEVLAYINLSPGDSVRKLEKDTNEVS